MWVANSYGSSVTEVNSRTGRLVRVIRGSKFAFNYSDTMAVAANHVWVGAGGGEAAGRSVTELDANTGALVRLISDAKYGFYTPIAMDAAGKDLWIANYDAAQGNSVTELNANTGVLVRLIGGLNYSPDAIAVADGRVWVAIEAGGSRENAR